MLLALKLFAGRALGFLKALPWQLWLAMAIAAALFIAARWHGGQVADARAAGDKAGYARAMGEVEARAIQIARKARAIEQRINSEIRSRTDEENRRNPGRADDLRVRGAGKGACAVAATVSRGPGGRVAPGGGAGAAADQLPEPERIAVPFAWIVDQAEVCDLNRGEVLAWREWHGRFTKEWDGLSR